MRFKPRIRSKNLSTFTFFQCLIFLEDAGPVSIMGSNRPFQRWVFVCNVCSCQKDHCTKPYLSGSLELLGKHRPDLRWWRDSFANRGIFYLLQETSYQDLSSLATSVLAPECLARAEVNPIDPWPKILPRGCSVVDAMIRSTVPWKGKHTKSDQELTINVRGCETGPVSEVTA